jgi:very-short-patch-repair endonuclease
MRVPYDLKKTIYYRMKIKPDSSSTQNASPSPSKEGNKSRPESLENLNDKQRPDYFTSNLHNYRFLKEIKNTLKVNQTEAEKIMWELLRNKKTGHSIRRQHIIDNFIADFVCLPKKVIIEIDGKIHLKQKEQDELRTSTLNEKGYKVIRFKNEDVFTNARLVVRKIKEVLDNRNTIINDDSSESPSLEGLGRPFNLKHE